jgi:DNA replication protein DnaC
LASFKPLYADFGSKDMDALLVRHDRLCKDHPLLVIDEIHVCEEQKIKNRFMIDTLDKRYANLVDTIIISNESELEFKANTDPSIQSRMREHGRILECSWESWR